MQLHLRFASSEAEAEVEDKVGLVCNSKLRMAESRSERAVEAPCIAVPPERVTLALGAGDEVRED